MGRRRPDGLGFCGIPRRLPRHREGLRQPRPRARAVAMYRRNNEGLDASETRWFPSQYMDAVWRIARLSEELGDA